MMLIIRSQIHSNNKIIATGKQFYICQFSMLAAKYKNNEISTFDFMSYQINVDNKIVGFFFHFFPFLAFHFDMFDVSSGQLRRFSAPGYPVFDIVGGPTRRIRKRTARQRKIGRNTTLLILKKKKTEKVRFLKVIFFLFSFKN